MIHSHDAIREHLLSRSELEKLQASEWSPDFEHLMRNRLLIGSFRYGGLHAGGKPNYDRIESIIKRAHNYKSSGNDELLVDIANLALCEYEEGTHPSKHFSSIDDGEHVNIKHTL